MKITLTELINRISAKEKEFKNSINVLNQSITKDSVKELTGTITNLSIIEPFEHYLDAHNKIEEELIKLKSLLTKKNNTIKIEKHDKTLQEVIIMLTLYRQKLNILKKAKDMKPSISRCMDYSHNSQAYFSITELNYNLDMNKEVNSLEEKIFELDSLIQKANNETLVEI